MINWLINKMFKPADMTYRAQVTTPKSVTVYTEVDGTVVKEEHFRLVQSDTSPLTPFTVHQWVEESTGVVMPQESNKYRCLQCKLQGMVNDGKLD